MKYKHLAMIMGVIITATSVGSTATAFAADSKTESTQDAGDKTEDKTEDATEDTAEASDKKADDSKEETNENEILGEVKSVEDGKITIAIGTRKEMGQPGEQPQGDGNAEAPEKPDGEALDGNDQAADGQETPDGAGAGQSEEITLDDIKEGGDNSSFYGVGAAVLATDGTTYVEGDSDYTITVDSYQDSTDTSNATAIDDWSNYEVERPESL